MLLRIVAGLVVVGLLIQLIPRGRIHTNAPVTQEPTWDSPQTRELTKRACFDCHSNETVWPWYSRVAPVSWLVSHDVNTGRRHLNFSEWNKPQRHAHHIIENIRSGDMPLWYYTPMHSTAKLTDAEKTAIIAGFSKMPGFEDKDEKDDDK